ncbi:MAG: glycosyltransferase [Roseovarius sp.]|jgi:glycosyltransferase involved in cell wall biosynthesis|nr:glycosyltransferase [Roseovarius sp.]
MTAGHDQSREIAHDLARAGRFLAEAGDDAALNILHEAVDLCRDTETLGALCEGALNLYDLDCLNEALPRLAASGGSAPGVQAFIEDVRSGPLRAADLAGRLQNRQAQGLSPVPGRVLYVLHKSVPYASDGYATRSHGLAKALLKRGVDLVCLTRPGFPFDLFPNDDPGQDIPPEQAVDGVVYHHMPDPTRTAFPRRPSDHMAHASVDYLEEAAKRLGAEIRRHRPACVVAASNHTTALPACLAAHAAGLPFVYEVRGFWEITHASRNPAYALTTTGRQERFLEVETARAAEAVLTLTAPMRDELIARDVDPERISLVPNSCDPDRFVPVPRDAALMRALGLPPDVPVIGYVGSFTQYEGLDDLTLACAALRRSGRAFRLLLIGSEPPDAAGTFPITEKIKRIAQDQGMDDWLILPGRVPHDDVGRYYSLIDIAPFPRKSQPVTELVSPLKPLEALAMEKAVVVSSVAGLAGMVRDNETGLVSLKGDIGALTAALERLVEDEALRHRLGQEGRRWVIAHRSWERTADKLAVALQHLAGL